jgi:hypothetical protein
MQRFVLVGVFVLACVGLGCPKRDLPPESSYDPDLVRTAKQIAAEQDARDRAAVGQHSSATVAGECSRETGGCPQDSICWDSWYCKQDRPDQCSASGDKRCHKRCEDDTECPEKMPRCREQPLFKGSDRGVLEKFCVADE